jgi:NAD(P)-dependent dehydrogenase (short-subunit alcohol dehydrogenase family)
VITGGSSGLGLATAQRFVAEGAYVFITGRSESELNAAVKQIGKNVTAVQGDVSNLSDLDKLYATVKQRSHSCFSGCEMDRSNGFGDHRVSAEDCFCLVEKLYGSVLDG